MTNDSSAGAASAAPIVVVGAGPVGVRCALELLSRCPGQQVILYGDEEAVPYDRVQLSAFLLGEVEEAALFRGMQLPESSALLRRLGSRVVSIDRGRRCVRDARGGEQNYCKLVLATGSTPHVPDIPGIALRGVLRFRDRRDTERLFARRTRSRQVVILGGGLLGLETARAMRRFHTDVTVIEHNGQLMPRQLDPAAGETLRQHVERLGIRVVTGDGVRRVRGHVAVEGVELYSGVRIDCDTLVLATGIRSNVELALQSGVPVNRGIRVDDQLRTADPDIHAIGECAEHRGIVHGLVAPGLEQAAVAAAAISGQPRRYTGSTAATILKVAGLPVFGTGALGDNDMPEGSRRHGWRGGTGQYMGLVTHRGRLIGACGVGTLQGYQVLRDAVKRQRRIGFWQLRRYRRTGQLWPGLDDEDVSQWPAEAVICNCALVTRGCLSNAMASGCQSIEAVAHQTQAGTACGSCRPLVQRLLLAGQAVPAARGSKCLVAAAAMALLLAVFALAGTNLDDPGSVTQAAAFWRDFSFKQLSGYGLVIVVLASLLVTWRKRTGKPRGDMALWRVAHGGLAVLAAVVMLAHTGGRVGVNLDLALCSTFLAALVLGAMSALSVAREHRDIAAVRLRRRTTWIHLLLTWPLPALLAVHVVKAYCF